MRKWKTKDVTTLAVLQAYSLSEHPRRVDDDLVESLGCPPKIAWRAMERELNRDFVEFGVNLRGGWLSKKGEAKLKNLTGEDGCCCPTDDAPEGHRWIDPFCPVHSKMGEPL